MACLTAEQVLDIVTGEENQQYSDGDTDIEEDPSFPLPHVSNSDDEEVPTNETQGKSIIINKYNYCITSEH